MYLKIENPGITNFEFLSTLGLSSSRGNENKGVIGQFGTGAMCSIGVLLRNKIPFVIYSGNLKFDFFVYSKIVNDGMGDVDFKQICCRISGKDQNGSQTNRTEKLSVALGYGEMDWDQQEMACREFVSNALDRTIKEHGEWGVGKRVIVEPVEDNQVRAKSNTTRVFLYMTPQIEGFYHTLGKRFLHFSEPLSIKRSILQKNNRDIGGKSAAVIYRKGVMVREISETNLPSLFDYNFGDSLKLDECRNVNDSVARTAVEIALRYADKFTLVDFIRSTVSDQKHWEHTLNYARIGGDYSYNESQEAKDHIIKKWQEAYDVAFGNAIYCYADEYATKIVKGKGLNVKETKYQGMYNLMKKFGIKTSGDVLSKVEAAGNQVVPIPEYILDIGKSVWSKIEQLGLTNNKPMPEILGFRKLTTNGATIKGMASLEDHKVHINDEIFGHSHDLFHTFVHEFAHCITGAQDYTTDFQEFGFKLATMSMFPDVSHPSERQPQPQKTITLFSNDGLLNKNPF